MQLRAHNSLCSACPSVIFSFKCGTHEKVLFTSDASRSLRTFFIILCSWNVVTWWYKNVLLLASVYDSNYRREQLYSVMNGKSSLFVCLWALGSNRNKQGVFFWAEEQSFTDYLTIYAFIENIFSKQSGAADKGWLTGSNTI